MHDINERLYFLCRRNRPITNMLTYVFNRQRVMLLVKAHIRTQPMHAIEKQGDFNHSQ